MKIFKETLLLTTASTLFLIAGCTGHFNEMVKTENEAPEAISVLDEITKNMTDAKKNKANNSYFSYTLLPDRGDFDDLDKLSSKKKYDINIESSVGDVINFWAGDIQNLNIVYDLENPSNLNKKIKINIESATAKTILEIIEKSSGLDFYTQSTKGSKKVVLYVKDNMILKSNLTKVEINESKSYEKLKEYLNDVLVDKNEENNKSPSNFNSTPKSSPSEVSNKIFNDEEGVSLEDKSFQGKKQSSNPYLYLSDKDKYPSSIKPEIIIDEATGVLKIKADPRKIRESSYLIETYINSALSYATVEMKIYRINNERAREVGISANKIIENLSTISAGVQADGIINKTISFKRDVEQANGDVFQAGLNLYEKHGLLRSQSNTLLTVFNNVPTSMSDIQTIGYWIPGDLQEDTKAINGAITTTYSESRPEFIEEDIGREIIFTPRINIDKQVINMAIKFSDSKIYKTEKFTWKRNANIDDVVEIKKPLKSKNSMDAILTINEDKYSIFAGIQSKEGEISRKFIPGTGSLPILQDIGANKTSAQKTETLFILKAIFPKNKKNEYITKVRGH